ncbi:ATP-binding protein [Ideonella sp.]|uniref:ATP-binding protein n=1 Tax=Ideonella sp. TaxID=1929293 RepID=UPI0035AF6331
MPFVCDRLDAPMRPVPRPPIAAPADAFDRQRVRRLYQIAVAAAGAFGILGVANAVRGIGDQATVLLVAGTGCLLLVRVRRWLTAPWAPLCVCLACIGVLATCSWLGGGLMDAGNYAYPAVLGMCGLLLSRPAFLACCAVTLGALGIIGLSEIVGGRVPPLPPAVGLWHLLDVTVITLATAFVATLILDDVRRALAAMGRHQSALARANERLARSEALFRGLFDSAPVGLARLGADGLVADTNQALARALGRPRAALAGQAPAALFDARDAALLHQALAVGPGAGEPGAPGAGGAPGRVELRLATAGDDTRHARLHVARHGGAGPDDAAGVMLALEDVTQDHRLRALERAKAAAEERSRAQSELLSHVGHELRTPLNAMLGHAQLLRRDGLDGRPDTARALEVMESAGWHLAAMIDDLLDLSRLQGSPPTLQERALRLAPQVASAWALVEAQARARNVRLDATRLDACLAVRADPTRLRQVLLNLLSNAVKYNVDGGAVTVAARALPAQGPAATVELTVNDAGDGLTAAQQARLFEPFNRLGREAGTVPGTGIGLVITRSLVELMGGQLRVHSAPGEGSTFAVSLPAAAGADDDLVPEPSPGDASAAPPDPGYPARRVVYVEDNPVNAEIMRAILQARPQVTLEIHGTAQAGREAVEASPPDLLLLDLQLGASHGLDLLAGLRSSPATAGVPVLVVSADVQPATRAAALAAGATGFIGKPLALGPTLHQVDRVLAADPASR